MDLIEYDTQSFGVYAFLLIHYQFPQGLFSYLLGLSPIIDPHDLVGHVRLLYSFFSVPIFPLLVRQLVSTSHGFPCVNCLLFVS